MSGELGRVTVVVFQKVTVGRDVGVAIYHAGKRAISPIARPLVSVIDFTAGRRVENVNGRSVHFGDQHRGERAVLSRVRAAFGRYHRRRAFADGDPERKPVHVLGPRPQYVRYPFR